MLGKSRTRGHSLRIKGKPFRSEMRKNFFTQRVVNLWNSLPKETVEATSVNKFKTRLDRFLHQNQNQNQTSIAKYVRTYMEFT
ncbi:hypothetical protein CUC53_18430, partial [Aeromonas cavernicola]